jgi:hypothetical protein
MRTDPTDTGGLFTGRRPGTAPVRYRALPQMGSAARRRADNVMAFGIAVVMVFINLLFWGPLPAGWLWIGSRVDYWTDSVSLGIFVAFLGLMLNLVFALAVLKRLDHAWIIVRRAAGHDQRTGIIAPIFAVCAAVGATLFIFWLVFIGGLGSSVMPKNGG